LIDYGQQGEIMGIEMIDASTLTKANPLNEIVIKIQDRPRLESHSPGLFRKSFAFALKCTNASQCAGRAKAQHQ
jgi:hypothetical protein